MLQVKLRDVRIEQELAGITSISAMVSQCAVLGIDLLLNRSRNTCYNSGDCYIFILA